MRCIATVATAASFALCGLASASPEPAARFIDIRALRPHEDTPQFSALCTERTILGTDPAIRQLDSTAVVSRWDTLPTDFRTYAPPVKLTFAPEELENAIVELVPGGSWDDLSHGIEAKTRLLHVATTPEALHHVEGLLTALTHRSLRRTDLTLALVPHQVFRAVVKDAGPILDAVTLDAVVRAAGDRSVTWRGLVAEGEPVRVAPSAYHIAVTEYSVYSTRDIPAVVPLRRAIPSGPTAWVHLVGTPSHTTLRCECLLGLLDGSTPPRTRATAYGTLALPEMAGTLFVSSALLTLDRTVVLGEVTHEQTRLVALARALPASPPPPPDSTVHVFEVGPLVSQECLEYKENDVRSPRLHPQELESLAREFLPLKLREDPDLSVRCLGSALFLSLGTDITHMARARSILGAALQKVYLEKGTPCEMGVLSGVVERDALERLLATQSDPGLLPADWRTQIELSDLSEAHAFVEGGRTTTVWSGTTQSYVAAIENVTGRVLDTEIEAPYPVVRSAPSAFCVNATLTPDLRSGAIAVHLSGSITNTAITRTAKVRTGKLPVFGDRAASWVIDLPEQRVTTWNHTLRMQSGRAYVVSQASVQNRPASTRVVIAEARIVELPSP